MARQRASNGSGGSNPAVITDAVSIDMAEDELQLNFVTYIDFFN